MNPAMFSRRIIFLCLAVALLFIFACSGGSSAPLMPAPNEAPQATGTRQALAVATGAVESALTATPVSETPPEAGTPSPQPAIPEQRRVTLEFPPKMRVGDSDVIRLTLEVDNLGNVTPTAQIGGNVIVGKTVQIPNLYETYYVTVQARLDMAGMEVRPPEMISEPLEPGQSATFYWSVRPQGTGRYRGTAWLFLQFVDKVSGQASQIVVSAQPVEMEAVSFFGLSADLARTTGAIGSFIGGIVGFPFFKDIIKFILGLRKKGRTNRS